MGIKVFPTFAAKMKNPGKVFSDIRIIGFDADDTLWVNEENYQEAERQFCEILRPFIPEEVSHPELFKTEIQNLEIYGYGAKGFTLSMIETALRIAGNDLPTDSVGRIIAIGKQLLERPIILFDGVEKVLKKLEKRYKLILATKGDLLDQERKLANSGLAKYFHHIEIMSDKKEKNYRKLIRHLDIGPSNFLMIGNSLRSDILPVVKIGARAIHIPCETTWLHENIRLNANSRKFVKADKLSDIIDIL